ncbi:MAG: hypothetical protein MJ230_01640 [bacterium]|nr:hypothetical protein [bacterium]
MDIEFKKDVKIVVVEDHIVYIDGNKTDLVIVKDDMTEEYILYSEDDNELIKRFKDFESIKEYIQKMKGGE